MSVEATVMDEAGLPVQDATLSTIRPQWLRTRSILRDFLLRRKLITQWREIKMERLTNEKGMAKFRLRNALGAMGATVEKDGYYQSVIIFKAEDSFRSPVWLPYPMKKTVVLKKIRNPIPLLKGDMYRQQPFNLEIPLGFDMLKNEWMPPHGKGETEDMVVFVQKFPEARRPLPWASVQFTFTGEANGIQKIPDRLMTRESVFSLPYMAFLDGYSNQEVTVEFSSDSEGKRYRKSNLGDGELCFRIRTQLDEEQNVISALYGVFLQTEMRVQGRPTTAILKCPYFINPTPNNRNLEWDGTNLLKK